MYTAIVVDDESITRMDFSGLLTELGLRVLGEAADGFDAVELCQARRPDVVLMDLEMAIFDGASAMERIVRDDLAGSVIVITAYSDEATITRAVEAGAAAYLMKPVSRPALYAALQLALARRRQTDALHARIAALEAEAQQARLVDRAKARMAEAEGISEAEAYRRIQKLSMDKRCAMAAIAQHYLESRGAAAVQQAKRVLMQESGHSEKAAFQRLQALAEARGCGLEQAAKHLLAGRTP